MDAGHVMVQEVVRARPDHTVAEVARLLADHHLGGVPVCDEQDQVLGMVSEGDLMRPFWQSYDLGRAWWLEILAEGEDLGDALIDYMGSDSRRVRDVMTAPVITAPDWTPLPELARLMMDHGIKRVPILRNGRLAGIVTRANLIAALARQDKRRGVAPAATLPTGSTNIRWQGR